MASPATATSELHVLDRKIKALLPSQYQHCYDTVKPESMGSAGLKYGRDGRVAWDEIWTSFCDLALAGGPPHRGKLLQAVRAEEALEIPAKYQEVVEELSRGLWMVTRLPILPRIAPGWVGVRCQDEPMAAWLVRAIVVENVSARRDGTMLYLPVGPEFRLEKEIKNVVTSLAKTCHYWCYHMAPAEQAAAAAVMAASPLLQPELPDNLPSPAYETVAATLVQSLRQQTSLAVETIAVGWLGMQCPDVATAVWLMRALLVENILVRREEAVLCLPVRASYAEVDCQRLVATVARAFKLWQQLPSVSN